jgi:hypothetical protein
MDAKEQGETSGLASDRSVEGPARATHSLERDDVERRVARFTSTVIRHPRLEECLLRLQELHIAGRHSRRKASGLLIHGATGTGKSTIAAEYEQRYPRVEEEERTAVPVLRVELPGQPTAKVIGEAMLEALGDPFAHVGTAEIRMSRVRSLLRACGVEMIIFDEVQHLTDNLDRRSRSIAADTLKNLMNDTGIPTAFVGTPNCRSYFFENQQLGRRCSPKIALEPFGIKDAEDKRAFFRVLKTLDAALPTANGSALVDPVVAEAIHFASFGLLGILMQLIGAALRKALKSGGEQLTKLHLREAFVEVIYPRCPNKRNPFGDQFDGLPLVGANEPFHGLAA